MSSRSGLHIKAILSIGIACCAIGFSPIAVGQDAVDRLQGPYLKKLRQETQRLAESRREPTRKSPLTEIRANLHVHSELSHDSRGKIEDIVAAAKRAGTDALLFTEHPSAEKDFYLDGNSGFRDGVLLIPGAEMKGMLVYPTMSLRGFEQAEPSELAPLVRERGGQVFLSHLEERMDWEIPALTGTEIYNTHADFKKQKKLLESLKNPLWLIKAAELIREYPQEVFTIMQTYPDDYLKRFDELCHRFPHTGVAANDAHQNIGVRIVLRDKDSISIVDALGEELANLNRLLVAPILKIPSDAQPGDTLFQLQLDPYENSLRHAGTHLLVRELSHDGVWEALDAGRTFVAFDGIADARGFEVGILTPNSDEPSASRPTYHEIGSHVPFEKGLKITGQSPLAGHWKLIREGECVVEADGDQIAYEIDQPGIYRVELWLDVADESRIWILSSPFYVTAAE
jgi:hypothetical protein